MTPHSPPKAHQNNGHPALEIRLASRVRQALTESSATLPHHLTERLRVSREQALLRARAARKVQTATVISATSRGDAVVHGAPGGWSGLPQWLSAVMPLVLLLVGLLLISQFNVREQIHVAADIDTQLLADDLPPAAYADPGFVQYLRRGPLP